MGIALTNGSGQHLHAYTSKFVAEAIGRHSPSPSTLTRAVLHTWNDFGPSLLSFETTAYNETKCNAALHASLHMQTYFQSKYHKKGGVAYCITA